MKKIILTLIISIYGLCTYAMELDGNVLSFASNMESCYGVPQEKVTRWLASAELDEKALSLMDRQKESRTWGFYKPLFIKDSKIINGYEFYTDNLETLKKAEEKYGVSRFVITAILGVETDYGRFRLQHRAIDTLATLAFNYPRRASFFENELKHLLILSDEENSEATEYMSSYAGAVGLPQFMPSNIKKFGVDFDKDGRIDLVNSKEDAIASIAKYLKKHGYRMDRPTAVKANTTGEDWINFANKGMRPRFTVQSLKENGIEPSVDVLPERKASFYELKYSPEESEYWLFFDNFYAITRYNPSVRYALAVTLLAFEIKSFDESITAAMEAEIADGQTKTE